MTKKYEFSANKEASNASALATTQAKVQPVLTIQKLVASDKIIQSAERTLGSRGKQFLTSVLALANSDSKIAECEPMTTYNACLTAATLDLPINQNLGLAYIVPFRNNSKGRMEAQFQMGYKGFIQLAIRSGKFETMNVREVRKDELLGVDEFSGEPKFKFTLDSKEPIVGYMAYFKLTSGFQKVHFMTLDELESHAKKYSQSYKKNFGVWKDNFEAMAQKTVLKLLISKYAPLSTEMVTAIEEDQKVGETYADNSARNSFEVENAKVEIEHEPSSRASQN